MGPYWRTIVTWTRPQDFVRPVIAHNQVWHRARSLDTIFQRRTKYDSQYFYVIAPSDCSMSSVASVWTQGKIPDLFFYPALSHLPEFCISVLYWTYFKWFEIVTNLANGNKAYCTDWTVVFVVRLHIRVCHSRYFFFKRAWYPRDFVLLIICGNKMASFVFHLIQSPLSAERQKVSIDPNYGAKNKAFRQTFKNSTIRRILMR